MTSDDRYNTLQWPEEPVDMVLDTDTYNEIDDQFALVYALLSKERVTVEAVYAAQFHNSRSSSPADGMQKSYEEILRILEHLEIENPPPVFKGCAERLPDRETFVDSPAVDDLIERARMPRDKPLYVVAIGAITNVASALIKAPDIADKIVVLWLGGHPTYWHHVREFNLGGDWNASRHVLDCGVPLVMFPAKNVSEHLRTTVSELEHYLSGRGRIGAYLLEIFKDYMKDKDEASAPSKVVWDIAAIGWLVNKEWCPSVLVASPILTSDYRWSHDPYRHLIREVRDVHRDAVFGDLFNKLP